MRISWTAFKLQSGYDFVTDRQAERRTDRRQYEPVHDKTNKKNQDIDFWFLIFLDTVSIKLFIGVL